MMRENAAAFFDHHQQPYLAARAAEAANNIIPVIKIDEFYDYFDAENFSLTEQDHVRDVGVVKLLSISRLELFIAPMGKMQVVRIEGTAAKDRQVLKKFLKSWEASKATRHLVLGPEMGLFDYEEESRQCRWLPKGNLLRESLISLWKEALEEGGFSTVFTPSMISQEELEKLYPKKNQEALHAYPFIESQGRMFALYPERRFSHARLYQSEPRSFEMLPIRYVEMAERFQESGSDYSLGLYNIPLYTADQFQIFSLKEEIQKELISSLLFFNKTIKILGFEYHWNFAASRVARSFGTQAQWKRSAQWLREALEACDFSFFEGESSLNEIGPRVEVNFIDRLGQSWKGPWIGFDWQCPEQLALRCRGKGGKDDIPVMITGSFFGSIERTIALLLEYHQGQLPLWLAPEQVRILPIGERNFAHAKWTEEQIKRVGFRVGVDLKNETLGCKIHAAEKARIPYVLIIGDREVKENVITVRSGEKEQGSGLMKLEHLIEKLRNESRGTSN
jgi:threonyl-tRNA synthetase